jgi:hypothetical protein
MHTIEATERLVIYCQTTSVSVAHATRCASYCTPCRPLKRAFSGWILTPPPTLFSFSCPFAPPLPPLLPLLDSSRAHFPYPSTPSSRRGGMADWSRSTTHPTMLLASPSTPPASTTPTTAPAAPIAHTSLPNLSYPALLTHPALEESGDTRPATRPLRSLAPLSSLRNRRSFAPPHA